MVPGTSETMGTSSWGSWGALVFSWDRGINSLTKILTQEKEYLFDEW